MPKAQKQISRARKVRKVSTMKELVKAYGGLEATAEAFHTTVKSVKQMKVFGLPCTHFVGSYLGLKARGFEPSPKLFGVKRMCDLPGAAMMGERNIT